MGREGDEHSMKELIQNFVNRNGKQRLYGERVVVNRWAEYVGPLFAKYTRCTGIRNGILIVEVRNAALRFEIVAHKSLIIKKINENYPQPVVKDIWFR